MSEEPQPEINRELIQQLCLEAGRIMEGTSANLALVLPCRLDLIAERVDQLRHAASDILALANAASALARISSAHL